MAMESRLMVPRGSEENGDKEQIDVATGGILVVMACVLTSSMSVS
jgi:hypothetical protein